MEPAEIRKWRFWLHWQKPLRALVLPCCAAICHFAKLADSVRRGLQMLLVTGKVWRVPPLQCEKNFLEEFFLEVKVMAAGKQACCLPKMEVLPKDCFCFHIRCTRQEIPINCALSIYQS